MSYDGVSPLIIIVRDKQNKILSRLGIWPLPNVLSNPFLEAQRVAKKRLLEESKSVRAEIHYMEFEGDEDIIYSKEPLGVITRANLKMIRTNRRK